MLFVDELQFRYMKSSTTPIASTLSPLPIAIDIWGLPSLLHSYIIWQFSGRLFHSMYVYNSSSYLEVWTFNSYTCTIKPIFVCHNWTDGPVLPLPALCWCFDFLLPVVFYRKLLRRVTHASRTFRFVHEFLTRMHNPWTNLYAWICAAYVDLLLKHPHTLHVFAPANIFDCSWCIKYLLKKKTSCS